MISITEVNKLIADHGVWLVLAVLAMIGISHVYERRRKLLQAAIKVVSWVSLWGMLGYIIVVWIQTNVTLPQVDFTNISHTLPVISVHPGSLAAIILAL